jgi:hypothetical protein
LIVIIGRALYWLLCAMTAPNPPIPNLPPVQTRPEPPPPSPDNCEVCGTQPRRDGTDYCGDACQATWIASRNQAIPIPAAATLPDGSTYHRRTW